MTLTQAIELGTYRRALAQLQAGGHGSGPQPGQFHVFQHGGSIGEQGGSGFVSSHPTKEEATDKAKRMNKLLSPGEKKFYGIRYKVHTDANIPKRF